MPQQDGDSVAASDGSAGVQSGPAVDGGPAAVDGIQILLLMILLVFVEVQRLLMVVPLLLMVDMLLLLLQLPHNMVTPVCPQSTYASPLCTRA